jgi:GNAT superfamily N-acetyltransferase
MANYEVRLQTHSVEGYICIRVKAGLSCETEEAAAIGLRHSLFAVTVVFRGEPIGIGRVIGGGCFFEIVDIAVLPRHHKKGVGKLIMEALMAYIYEDAPESAYVSLMADHGTPAFYEKFGFTKAELPNAAGMYLRL